MEKRYRLLDNSYCRSVDVPYDGKEDWTLHNSENWKGGTIVTIYMDGVNFFSEMFLDKKQYCDVIVKSVDTGKLYYTRKAFLSEWLFK